MREREKRERERSELRTLVGSALMRLGSLEGVDLPTYRARLLPRLLEQIVGCKDVRRGRGQARGSGRVRAPQHARLPPPESRPMPPATRSLPRSLPRR